MVARTARLHPGRLRRISGVVESATVCGIAFGSNLGDRLANLSAAKRALLACPEIQPLAFSAVYESAPVGCELDTAAFLNAVGEISYDGDIHSLLQLCQSVERKRGRPSRRPKNAPRTIDLDLLYAGDLQLADPGLTLPHPRLHERRFVLEPLAEIRPALVLPGGIETLQSLAKNLVCAEPPLRMVAVDW